MAFNSFLRRASASKLALAIGSPGTHSASDGVISAVRNVQNRNLIGRQFLQLRRFSTSTGADVQDGFPFKFQEHEWGSRKGYLYLERQLHDETIKVIVWFDPYDRNIPQLKMSVWIDHKKYHLEFGIDVFPDQMSVRYISMRGSGCSETFKKFWEIRGMKPSTTNFLFDYCNKKQAPLQSSWSNVILLKRHIGVGDGSSTETPNIIGNGESCSNSKPN